MTDTAVETTDPAGEPDGPQAPAMIAVSQLTAHPGNVRDDLELTAEFCASIAELGVRIPLLITPAGDGYRVIEGHRRLAAVVKAGHTEVPCVLDAALAKDEAGQYLDMVLANSDSHRRNFTPVQEALALFAAHEAGASRTRIRKATGRKADQVKTALAAGKMSPQTREQALALPRQATLDELALLAEFDGDEDATETLLSAIRWGHNVEYAAERIRQERAEAAEYAKLRADLEAGGYQVTEDMPPGAMLVGALTHDGEPLTEETHAECPGRGVCLRPWNRLKPSYYCTDRVAHGHGLLFEPVAPPAEPRVFAAGGGDEATPEPADGPAPAPAPPEPEPAPDPARRLVIEGNKAWSAAAQVRRRWLRELFTRRTAPKGVAQFVTKQLLSMPEPLRRALGTAHSMGLFDHLTGHPATVWAGECGTYPTGRLPLLMLAALVTAYESEIHGPEDSKRATWRPEKWSPCPTRDAGVYLAFLRDDLGYELSPVERSVADGTPYTGDNPPEPLTAEAGHAAPDDSADGPDDPPWDTSGHDHAGEDRPAGDGDAAGAEDPARQAPEAA